ncbi:hypothetical protein [uncultured Methanobrevibacter sp.]|uniref:hypothetical protein n=1 Tax=uncultured Methanobrevibacter sp. TaxID=253161 RepID=UPI0025DD3D9B|nr:hypothetical protein [uncultured Methanobrevibacter sp.]
MTYYQRINLGNHRDFVIKNIDEPETYGTFQFGDEYDKKSMDEFIEKVNRIIKENQELKEENKFKSQMEETLQKHYDYAEFQRLKYLKNAEIHAVYNMLRVTIKDIADELEVDLKNNKLDYKSAFNKGMDHVIKNHPEGLFK